MKIIERNESGELKFPAIDLQARIFAEQIKSEEITMEDVPEEMKEEVSKLL